VTQLSFFKQGLFGPAPSIEQEFEDQKILAEAAVSYREKILENAIRHTCGDRNQQYGSPESNFSNTADLWNAYLRSKYWGKAVGHENLRGEFVLTAEDVAWLMVLLKLARTVTGQVKTDTYEDAAAYAACAGECAILQKNAELDE
jgi:hypothetical protein